MAVTIYWTERLKSGKIFWDERRYIDRLNVRRHGQEPGAMWPNAVSRSALYDDYVAWFNAVYIKPYENSALFENRPEAMPQPADELVFYSTLSPWVYIVDKNRQVRSYLVDDVKTHSGRWAAGKKRANFIRLFDVETHIVAFELNTGIDMSTHFALNFDAERVHKLHRERETFMSKVQHNRKRLYSAMGTD